MCCQRHNLSLVVVYDLYVVSVALLENTANAPTCIHGHCLGLASMQHDIDANGIEWKNDQAVSGLLQNTSF